MKIMFKGNKQLEEEMKKKLDQLKPKWEADAKVSIHNMDLPIFKELREAYDGKLTEIEISDLVECMKTMFTLGYVESRAKDQIRLITRQLAKKYNFTR
jgi:hypothetical protein